MPTEPTKKGFLEEIGQVAGLVPRGFGLVWGAGPVLTSALLCLNLVLSFTPVVTLWMTKLTIDRITLLARDAEQGNAVEFGPLWLLIGIMGAVWVGSRAIETLNSALSSLLRFKVEIHTQSLIMRKCADLDIAFFENPKNLDMLENAGRGAMMSAWSLVWMLFSLVRTTLTLGTFLVALTRLHWLVTLVVAVTTAPQMLASSYFARRRWKMMTDRAEDSRLRFYISWLMTQRDTVKEVKVFELSGYLLERFRHFCQKFFNQEMSLQRRQEVTNFGLGVLGTIAAVGIWVYIVIRAVARSITIGDIVFYTQAVSQAQNTLVSLFTQGGQIYEQTLFLGNLFALLDLKPVAVEGSLRGPDGRDRRWGQRPAPAKLQQGLELRNVSFRYPGSEQPVLRNVSFSLAPGESVALVGRNGAGKTTLVKLLTRLYDPTDGQILLDGHDLREYDIESLRGLFAVIFQDYCRFHLTLRENVGFGDVRDVANIERIRQVSEQTGADEIAKRLPKQYETYLGRQFMGLGEDLSGGEWQKIALARAYMRDCPVLILDEPTASLDAFAEYEVYKSFEEKSSGRLVVFISHRFSTVRMARHILVLDNGELVEQGSHEALLARDGLYASMFNTQADRYR
jgi:ATP-binding cassette subfamily B protein